MFINVIGVKMDRFCSKLFRIQKMCVFTLIVWAISSPMVFAQAPSAGGKAKSKGAKTTAGTAVKKGATPEEVAKAFVEAGNNEDVDALFALMTAKAREALQPKEGEKEGAFQASEAKFENPVIGTATIEGEVAKVPVTVTKDGQEEKQILMMRKDAGEWRLSGAGAALPGGGEMIMEFEMVAELARGLGEAMKEGFEEMGKNMQENMQKSFEDRQKAEEEKKSLQFAALASISEEEFSKSWKRNYSFKNKPAREVLAELAKELGIQMDPAGVSEAIAKKITLNLKEVSVVQAIDAVATQAGLTVRFPGANDGAFGNSAFGRKFGERMQPAMEKVAEGMLVGVGGETKSIKEMVDESAKAEPEEPEEPEIEGPALRFEAGVRKIPSVHTGPFVVSVEEVEENAPHGTGRIEVKAIAPAMHEGIVMFCSRWKELLVVDKVSSSKGLVHFEHDTGTSYVTEPQQANGVFILERNPELRRLLKSVQTISSVTGKIKLSVPEEVVMVRFDSIEAGKKTVGTVEVELIAAKEESASRLKVTALDNPNLDKAVHYMWYDREGTPLDPSHNPFSGARGNTWESSGGVEGDTPPESVEVKVISKTRDYEFPFEFKNVPLKDFAKMPEKEIKLEFGAHPAPCSATFVKFTNVEDKNFPKFEMQIINHSNKTVKNFNAKKFYLDAAGKDLDDSFGTTNGGFKDGDWQPVVEAKQTVTKEETAFHMPEGTQGMRIEIQSVEFIDGEEWRKEK